MSRCLGSVRLQIPEVVYVDSGSSDGSTEAARAKGVAVISLREPPFTAARGRQAGFEELDRRRDRLDYVLFIDGDCILEPGFIAAAIKFLDENPRVGVVTGRRREENRASFYSRMIDIDWDIPPGEVSHVGGDSLWRGEAIRQVGGWPIELIAGEEPDLCFRMRDLGWGIQRLPIPMTIHDVQMRSFRAYWRRAVRSGHAYAEVGLRHRRGSGRCWLRSVASILLYGVVLPVLMAALIPIFWPAALLIALLYMRLWVSMVIRVKRKGSTFGDAMAYAGLNVICKAAAAIGVAKYVFASMSGKRAALIEYKPAPGVTGTVAGQMRGAGASADA